MKSIIQGCSLKNNDIKNKETLYQGIDNMAKHIEI